ncbi:hypothetical protein CAI21_00275 [Alkalilimnicola ehrlichii]|nr:hypothetical protein CAI21_00275 [Alkalilimnicola ehrlichii]
MSFNDVVEAGMMAEAPVRLLFLFVKIEEIGTQNAAGPRSRTLEPVMVTDKLAAPDLDFDGLIEEADKISPGWDFVLISSLMRGDGNIPHSDEAEPHLQQMANSVVSGGDLSHYLVFDREENPIRIETSPVGGTA